MADDPSGGEKTEQPTPKKIRDAHDEGQVAFSTEINTVGILLMGFIGIGLLGPWWWEGMALAIRRSLTDLFMSELSDGPSLMRLASGYGGVLVGLAAFFVLTAGTGLMLSIAQVGLHVTAKPLAPKAQRINPLSGFKRIFGMRGLVKTGLGAFKMFLVASIGWWVIQSELPRMVHVDDRVAMRFVADATVLWWLAIKLILVLVVVAALDALYQRWQHGKDLMMTKHEVKQEFKQAEGDPLIKSKIRQIQRQMAQRRMMQEVPKADVVITNPTHVAVALRYDREAMNAPVVVAKGFDAVAQRIKALAAEHGIPQVENIPLARALAKDVEIGRAIPGKWYEAVAEVLAAVYKLKKGAEATPTRT